MSTDESIERGSYWVDAKGTVVRAGPTWRGLITFPERDHLGLVVWTIPITKFLQRFRPLEHTKE